MLWEILARIIRWVGCRFEALAPQSCSKFVAVGCLFGTGHFGVVVTVLGFQNRFDLDPKIEIHPDSRTTYEKTILLFKNEM